MKILSIVLILSSACAAAFAAVGIFPSSDKESTVSEAGQSEAVLKFKTQATPAEQQNVLDGFIKTNSDVSMKPMFAESMGLKNTFPQRQKRAASEEDLNKVKDRLENVYVVKVSGEGSPEFFCQKFLVDPQVEYCQPNTRMFTQSPAP